MANEGELASTTGGTSTLMNGINPRTDPDVEVVPSNTLYSPQSSTVANGGHVNTNGVNLSASNEVNADSSPMVKSGPKKVTISEVAGGERTEQPRAADKPANGDQDEVEGDDDDGVAGEQTDLGASKKKRKSKRPKSKRGLNAPSGFEEYYVDAPLTPAEFEEEKQIYDSSYRFTQRIETAIQRFFAKRRFDAETKNFFDKYLVHGGVDAGPKMFGGGLDLTKNAAEIAELAATHYVDADKVDSFDSTHVVDFEGCLKSFLSGPLREHWVLTSEARVKGLIGIIRNFLNYLLHHDVCPEYKDQINAARSLCDKAVKEIWDLELMAPLLPGEFNMACSEIFGGMYQGSRSGKQSWMEDTDMENAVGIDPKHARHVFQIGIAANASDEMFPVYKQQRDEKDCRLVATEEVGLEVTEIIHADEMALNLYGQQRSAGLQTLGKIKAKTCHDPRTLDEDLTEEEELHCQQNSSKVREYEFWVEENILEKCHIGIKLTATVRETSFGLYYFDAIAGLQYSFSQTIPNEMMENWRDIEKEWLPMKYNKYLAAKKEEQEKERVDGTDGIDGAAADEIKPITDEEAVKSPTDEHPRLKTELEDVAVNKNIVGAGYDEEYDEIVNSKRELKQEGEAMNATTEGGFGVEVHKAGEERVEVSDNAETVVQETFDVNRVTETE